MGGKPLKPKIQAYVEQRWFDEFEVYRSTYNLNQSKALEKILAEFFGGFSNPTSPPDEVIDVNASLFALRSELMELRLELEQRLHLVENRLEVDSAVPLNGLASESATSKTDSAMGLNELAYESAVESAIVHAESVLLLDELGFESATASNRLADESAILLVDLDPNPRELLAELDTELADESATTLDKVETNSVDRLADGSAVELDSIEVTTALDESIESAASSVDESALVEDAIAHNPIEEVNPTECEDVADAGNTLGDAQDSLPVEIEEDASLALALRQAAAIASFADGLNASELAKRLKYKAASSITRRPKGESEEEFKEKTKELDPDGIAWILRESSDSDKRVKILYFPCADSLV